MQIKIAHYVRKK